MPGQPTVTTLPKPKTLRIANSLIENHSHKQYQLAEAK
jgi:hypothetical protein